MVTDDIPVEIVEINAYATAATSDCAAGASSVSDLVLAIGIKIRRNVVLFYGDPR